MKPFSFTLQAVKTVREQEENAAQLGYAAALQARELAAGRLALAQAGLEGIWDALRSCLRGGTRVEEIERLRAYGLSLEDRVRDLERALCLAAQALERARETMLRATRNREALDKVQRRQRAQYDYAVARLEHKLLDELASRPSALSAAWRATSEL